MTLTWTRPTKNGEVKAYGHKTIYYIDVSEDAAGWLASAVTPGRDKFESGTTQKTFPDKTAAKKWCDDLEAALALAK